MVENINKVFDNLKLNPNKEKVINAKNMKNNIDLTKELITKYLISTQGEYKWLCNELNIKNVDRDWKLEAKKNKTQYYENTLEYKIKHPFYILFTKLHIYPLIKKILKKGE